MQNISSKTTPILYRPHRSMLADAMREVVEVNDLPQLVRHMRRGVESWYPKDELPTENNTKLEPYGFDARIGWDTYIVTVKGNAWGFTNGPLVMTDEAPIDQGNPWDKVREMSQQLELKDAEIARLKAGAAHTAGFLDGMAKRIEGWVRLDGNIEDTANYTKGARDCLTMAESIKHYMLG